MMTYGILLLSTSPSINESVTIEVGWTVGPRIIRIQTIDVNVWLIDVFLTERMNFSSSDDSSKQVKNKETNDPDK